MSVAGPSHAVMDHHLFIAAYVKNGFLSVTWESKHLKVIWMEKKHKKAVSSCKSSYAMTAFLKPKTVNCVKLNEVQVTGAATEVCNTIVKHSELPQTTSSASVISSKSLQQHVMKDSVTKAEVLCCLTAVSEHISMSATGKYVQTFKLMFPDSNIASEMKLQRAKISYTIVYGLAPYFHKEVSKEIAHSPCFSAAFDESLNKVSQEEQMDLVIKYWCESKRCVVSRYFSSAFLGHTTSEDILQAFKKELNSLDMSKMVQVSMDGPNTNLKFLRDLKEDLEGHPSNPSLLDLGTCGLHTLHNAFKSGVTVTNWKIVELLRAAYNVFKNVPARRADYTSHSGSRLYPKKFCAVRWLQNQDVAKRMQEILPNLVKYIAGTRKAKKEPKSASYHTLVQGVSDKMIGPKLAFFQTVANDIEPFLIEFQAEKPLAPFLYTDILVILTNFIKKFVKKEVLQATPVLKIDLTKSENVVHPRYMDLGYGTREALRNLKASEQEILLFKNECLLFVQALCCKLLLKSPVKYKLAKGITFCDPTVIIDSMETSISRLKSSLEVFVQSKHLTGASADNIEREFWNICLKPIVKERLRTFTRKEYRLDVFWMDLLLLTSDETGHLESFLKKVFVLSHGNASVERGFSINKQCMVENQSQQSLVAQRQVYEAIRVAGGVECVVVDKPMIISAQSAYSRYKMELDTQKQEN